MSISVEKVKLELNRIKLLGFVENVKSDDNDGAIGNTFEHYLGYTLPAFLLWLFVPLLCSQVLLFE